MTETYEKYRGADAVILRHSSGQIRRLDPRRVNDDVLSTAKQAGWEPYDQPKDGFRTMRKRTRKQMERLIADGAVATEPQPHQTYGPDVFVVDVPVATLGGAGKPAGSEG